MISNFAIERPVHRKVYPSWDLTIVLNAPMKSPYEPLQNASLFNLTKKSIFLLLLASGARCSEIHALDINNVLFSKDSNSFWFGPNYNFKAKNFNVKTGVEEFTGFNIDSLSEFAGTGLPIDALLCPVRCMHIY